MRLQKLAYPIVYILLVFIGMLNVEKLFIWMDNLHVNDLTYQALYNYISIGFVMLTGFITLIYFSIRFFLKAKSSLNPVKGLPELSVIAILTGVSGGSLAILFSRILSLITR